MAIIAFESIYYYEDEEYS